MIYFKQIGKEKRDDLYIYRLAKILGLISANYIINIIILIIIKK
jgi:hypothetical protein